MIASGARGVDRIVVGGAARPAIARVLTFAALASAALARPAAAQVAEAADPTPAAADLADRLWSELDALPWGRTCEMWRASRPEAVCRRWAEPDRPIGVEDEWCVRGDHPALLGTLYFYGLEPDDPPSCRFGRYRAGIEEASEGAAPSRGSFGREELRAAERELERRLTAAYGEPSVPAAARDVPGVAYRWTSIRRWRRSDVDLFLFIRRRRDDRIALGLVARAGRLARAIARGEESRRSLAYRIRREAVRTVLADGPSLAPRIERLLTDPDGAPWSGDDVEDAVAVVADLLASADTLPGRAAAAAWLTADRLVGGVAGWMSAVRMRGPGAEPSDTALAASLGERLDALGLGLEWNELGASWHSPRPLLWRVWREHPETRAGEYAFLQLQLAGWDTSIACAEGADAFRRVIERGRTFLDERPESALRGYVAYTVAAAYETWWSLSRAPDDSPYVVASEYRAGADEARRRAVAHYAIAAPALEGTVEGDDAARRMARLHLGIDTRQRRYHCIYD
ncbi:MAG: hypothetical protein ACODAE_11545 [Gemmatimonadota bacterium]